MCFLRSSRAAQLSGGGKGAGGGEGGSEGGQSGGKGKTTWICFLSSARGCSAMITPRAVVDVMNAKRSKAACSHITNPGQGCHKSSLHFPSFLFCCSSSFFWRSFLRGVMQEQGYAAHALFWNWRVEQLSITVMLQLRSYPCKPFAQSFLWYLMIHIY